ncbi:hypothetical protein [Actinacidiphila sp. bgisy160]|uniref:hypothetical protein n=1 Tax=Actinacidiphila sp. bgisy160 TaxID=3413796 RepID=UPI003D765580
MSIDSSSSDRTSNAINDGSQVSGNAYQAKIMRFGSRSTGITLIAFAGVAGLTFLGFTMARSGPSDDSSTTAAGATTSATASISASSPPASLTPSPSPSTPPASLAAPVPRQSSEPAQAPPSGGAAGAAPTPAADRSITQCRNHTPTKIGEIATANPCIRIESNNTIYIYSDFTAQKTGQVTVFIWLIDGTGAPIREYMRACPVTFKSIGQTQGCSLRNITPPKAGQWGAAVTAEDGSRSQPAIWGSSYKGTQSGAVVWNPAGN